jgi:hypothetical protein
MAFQFPDPNVTPEFEGDNGITYVWDAADGKWSIKGFSADLDDRYVNEKGGDSMQGPLQVTGGRSPNADGIEGTVKALNIDSGQNSSLQFKHNGNTRAYLGDSEFTLIPNLKFNSTGKSIYAGNDKKGFTVNTSGVFYEGVYTHDRHVATKKNVDDALFTDATDPLTNIYLKRTGDSMEGQLDMTLGSGIKFTGLRDGNKAVEMGRNTAEFPALITLNHPGGSTLGGYDIRIGGNTSYNELRVMGGSNASTPSVTFKANGVINFFKNVSFNDHKITKLADATDQRDAVNLRQLEGSAADLQFNINLNASTQKSIRAGLDDLVAPRLQIVSEDPAYKNADMFEGAYPLFPGKDDYHHHHVDQRFILLARMFEGAKKTEDAGGNIISNNETLDSNRYGNDDIPNLAIQDLKTGKLRYIIGASVTAEDGGLAYPAMRGCHVIANDDGSCNAYLWVHNPLRTVNQSGFSNNACPLFRIFIPAEKDINDSSPWDNFSFGWTNIKCDKNNFTTPTTNPYSNYTDSSKKFQYEIQTETFHLRDKLNNKRYLFISYNKGAKDFVTQRLFEVVFFPNSPDDGVIVPVGAHPDSDNGVYAAGLPAIKKTIDGGVKCFLYGSPVGLTELYFVPDGAGEKLQLRNYQDYTPEGARVTHPTEVNDLGHPIITSKGIYDNWYKSTTSQPQWLTEGLWDEANPFSTRLIFFQSAYGVVSVPTENLGNKADEVKLENNYKGEFNCMHIEHNNPNYQGYFQDYSTKNLWRFNTQLVDTRSNGSVWFFDYKSDYVPDEGNMYNDTREFDAGGNKTFHYDFKRGIVEVRPNVPAGTIEVIGHSIGRKRSDNDVEEGNRTDFSGEAICRMYDQFVCVGAAKSHSSVLKPRVHVFDPFTRNISLVSDTEVNASTVLPVPQRGLVALADYGVDTNDDPTTMYYVSMLAHAQDTVNIRKSASMLRTLYSVTGTDVATAEDTWTLDAPVTPGTPSNNSEPESQWDDIEPSA